MNIDMCKIRRASDKDISSIIEINLEIHNIHSSEQPNIFKHEVDNDELMEYFVSLLANDENIFFVAEVGNFIVGYCWFKKVRRAETPLFYEVNDLHIIHIGVLSKYNGLGYGDNLINSVKEYGKSECLNKLQVDCWSFNSKAISFYNKHGFNLKNQFMWQSL